MSEMKVPHASKLSLKEFLGRDESAEVKALIGTFNGGSFMCCHTQIFLETGIWIDELVPVFQRLDAHLATSTDRRVRVLSPDAVIG
jgi:hypothetical protein